MTQEQIEAHWPIFKDWYLKEKKVGYMPSGALLITGWYEYCTVYNNMLDSNPPLIVDPVISDAPDD